MLQTQMRYCISCTLQDHIVWRVWPPAALRSSPAACALVPHRGGILHAFSLRFGCHLGIVGVRIFTPRSGIEPKLSFWFATSYAPLAVWNAPVSLWVERCPGVGLEDGRVDCAVVSAGGATCNDYGGECTALLLHAQFIEHKTHALGKPNVQ